MNLNGGAPPAAAQELRGRVLEVETETPVALAGVFLLDAEREIVRSVLADSVGRYRIVVVTHDHRILERRLTIREGGGGNVLTPRDFTDTTWQQ